MGLAATACILLASGRTRADVLVPRYAEAELAEAVVTARRREEKPQDVPISLTILSGRQLQLSHTYLVAQVAQSVPNMQLQLANPRQLTFSVRGLGNNPASEGLDTSVGLYLDGVYMSRPGMLASDLYDIEQVTVLRGPQGTLFGKNTTAGALIINTRRPEQSFKSEVELSYGRYGLMQANASITGPLSPQLSARVSGFATSRDGTTENRYDGAWLNNQKKVGGRAQLLFRSGALDLRFIADYAHQHENAGAQALVDPGLVLANGSARPNSILVRTARFDYTPTFDPFAQQVDINHQQAVETTNEGTSLEANWNLSGYTLTSISAWREWTFFPTNDMDYLPLDILRTSGSDIWNRQWSQELRVASPAFRNWDFVSGVFAYWQRLQSASAPGATYGADAAGFYSQPTLILPAYVLTGLTSNTRADVEADSYALFGQAAWHVTEAWDLTLGGRGNWDRKEALVSRTRSGGVPLDPTDPYFQAASAARNQLAPGNATADNASSGDTVSGSLSVSYRPASGWMLYGSLSRGVKAAGLNTNIVPAGVDPSIEPEIVHNVELGTKAVLLDHRLQLSGDLFWANIDNYQTTIRDPVLVASYLANAESAHTRGAELEVQWLVIDGLHLGSGVGYDDATYTSFHNAPCGTEWAGIATTCDLTGRPISGAPRWSGYVRSEYGRGLSRELQGTAALEYNFRSGSYYSADDSVYAHIPAYGLLDAHVNVGDLTGRWEVSLWARNLLNKEYFTSLSAGGAFGAGYVAGLTGDPRTYGVTVRLQF